MRNIESFYNIERDEFVQVVNFRDRTIKAMTWEEFWEVEHVEWIQRLPFRSELIPEKEIRRDYLDIHELDKPYGMSFWAFLVAEQLKDDFCEYENIRYRRAILKWFERNNLFSRLKMNVYLGELD